MGKIFIPMYTTATPHYSYSRRPVQRCERYYTRPACQQPSLLDVLLHGVLGQLQVRPESETRERQPWVRAVNLKGFQPDEISVKVEERTVHVTARSAEESDTGHDVVERYRKIQMPVDVNVEKLNCFFGENGKLILKAPYNAQSLPCTKNEKETLLSESEKPTSCSKQDTETGEKLSDDKLGEFKETEMPIAHPKTEELVENEKEETEDTANKVPDLEDEQNEEHSIEGDPDEPTIEKLSELLNNDDEGELHQASRPNSPQESLEFVILDQEEVTLKPEEEEPVESTENTLQITELDNDDESALPLMIDTTRVTEVDGEKQFEINVNLQHFKPENTSISWMNGSLQVRAEREMGTESLKTHQKMQRKYTVPPQCDIDSAHASMDDEGRLRVTIPLKN